MLGNPTPEKSLELSIPGTSRALALSMRRKSSDPGDLSSRRRSRWTYVVGALLGVALVGLYVHTRSGKAPVRLEVEHLEEASEEERVLPDGTFLADLGPEADEAYHLGPTIPEE